MLHVKDSGGDTRPGQPGGPAEPEAMFRVKDSEGYLRVPMTAAVVLGTLLLALALSAAAVYQVFHEHRLLGGWLARGEPVPASELRKLRQDIGTRIIIRSAALVALLL